MSFADDGSPGKGDTASRRPAVLTRQPGKLPQDLQIGGPQIFGRLICVNVVWCVGLWAGAEAAGLQQRSRDRADGCAHRAALKGRLNIQHVDQALLDIGGVIVFVLAGGCRLQIVEPAREAGREQGAPGPACPALPAIPLFVGAWPSARAIRSASNKTAATCLQLMVIGQLQAP